MRPGAGLIRAVPQDFEGSAVGGLTRSVSALGLRRSAPESHVNVGGVARCVADLTQHALEVFGGGELSGEPGPADQLRG